MLHRICSAVLLALLPSLSMADMLPGADDPYYTAAVIIALATDDMRALHALATAGNTAALVALPTIER